MKKLFLTLVSVLSFLIASAQDLTFDSVAIVSPYWGLKIESGLSGDPWMNCGQTNTNFASGQPYLLARFPVRISNMGNSVAYFGTYGITPGITHDSCYNNQFTSSLDFINIPNFVLSTITDSCGNVISSSRKTDWNIQNNSTFGLDKYNGVWTYPTNYFGLPPTTGNSANINKDWLESLCGPLDTNIAIAGKNQMNSYYNNCIDCDSLVLFPNYASSDYSVIQLPTNLSPGNYKLIISGNFGIYESSNCYPNTIEVPFNWDGSTGVSSNYPYFANGITYLSDLTCTPPTPPSAPTNAVAQLNNGIVNVTWSMPQNSAFTGFSITPIYVQGNTERRLTNRTIFCNTCVYYFGVVFNANDLRNDAIALGANNGPIKYKFVIKAFNGNLQSPEAKTRQSVNLR